MERDFKIYNLRNRRICPGEKVQKTDPLTLDHALFVPRPAVLSDETCARGIEGRHHIKNNGIRIDCRRVSRHYDCIKRVHAYLHIDTASHTDQKAGKQRDQQSRGANRSKRFVVRKLSNDRHVA